VVSNWTGSPWTRVLHEKFLYDGWNLLGAFNGTNGAIIRSFLWGLDLSGAQAGPANIQAVGGLLFFTHHSTPQPSTHCAAYDGNGNVMALVDGKTGSASARYEYDPFGQTIRASGTMATVNPVRFSSKVVDDETDYAYYGYRYLNPNAGRWLSRDPIEERGGESLTAFVSNDSINRLDGLGLSETTWRMGATGYFDRPGAEDGVTHAVLFEGSGTVSACAATAGYFSVSTAGNLKLNVYYPNLEVKEHELEHERRWKAVWNDFKIHALGFESFCFCNPSKAKCFADLVETKMKALYYEKGGLAIYQHECETYPEGPAKRKNCDRVKLIQARVDKFQAELTSATMRCMLMKD